MTDFVAIANNVIQSITNITTNIVEHSTVVNEPVISAAQGPQGIPGATTLTEVTDIDMTGLTDGALLVYNAQVEKWKPTTVLDKQALESGQY